MEKFFSIGKTAEMVNMTAETLRHYDRIGLVSPGKTDKWTGYRYYTQQEIVRLNTVHALQCMDLSLREIKQILEYNDFEKILNLLDDAEKNADKKIAELNYAKSKIHAAAAFYKDKLKNNTENGEIFIKQLPERVILLSNKLRSPSLDNLWDYHRNFYEQIDIAKRNLFSFEDLAGIYCTQNISRLFAVCTRYAETEDLHTLPEGRYLCSVCTQENRDNVLRKLKLYAEKQYNIFPEFSVQIVVLSGILQWNYQIQLYIGD